MDKAWEECKKKMKCQTKTIDFWLNQIGICIICNVT